MLLNAVEVNNSKLNFDPIVNNSEHKLAKVRDSDFDVIRTYLYFFVSCLIIAIALYNFDQNPVIVIVVVLFFTVLILISGYRRLTVVNDGIWVEYKKVLPFMSVRRFYRFDEIVAISFKLKLSKKGFTVTELLNMIFPASSVWNTVRIDFQNGTSREINTKIYSEKLIALRNEIRQIAPGKVDDI